MNKKQTRQSAHFRVRTEKFSDAGLTQVYRLYSPLSGSVTDRRLLLIHGAGVAGSHTWEPLIGCLSHWQEILVPDLRGAGDTHWDDRIERPFEVSDLVDDILKLINSLNWSGFDLGGYSLGGLVAMLLKQRSGSAINKQYLFESAILDRENWQETLHLGNQYISAARSIDAQASTEGIKKFLDTISPNRRTNPAVERLTMDRLGERSKGFAHALQSVSTAMSRIDREALLASQGDVSSFIGGLSVDPMHQLHRGLADRLPNWHYFLVPGTDHSLPYQKPRQIAKLMESELERYLGASQF